MMLFKIPILVTPFFLASLHVTAFPWAAEEADFVRSLEAEKLIERQADEPPPFDAEQQRISTTGLHKFVPPGPNDDRGPCPGLNALANHGYLPHSGRASILRLAQATKEVFGLGLDLGTVLAAYGGLFDGIGVEWSIGGNVHTGIAGSHNNYETDSSPLRADLYQYGTNSDLVMSQFYELYDMQPDPAKANYNLEVLREFRKVRLQESIDKNPKFYYGPFSGAVVSQAAFVFIYRLMGNKSAEFPEGRTDKSTLKSFMSIHGPEHDLKWIPGHERIPDNWYKRNRADLYSLRSSIGSDISFMSQGQPEITVPGCNMGKVDSFVQIEIANLTKGAYSKEDALANPFCFGLAFANTLANSLPIVNFVVQELILPIQNTLACKTIPSLDMSVAEACPGYSLYGGPTAKVAKGAIQE